jgi:non-homologous end joining protein Ku
VIDLMEALKASVAAAKGTDKGAVTKKPAATRGRAAAGRK